MLDAYIGTIIGFGGTYAPMDWAVCDGSLLKISDYQALFSLIGTTYGGDGVTTFALPNLMNRVPVGAGQGPGLSNRILGEAGGSAQVALTVNNYPAHTHSFHVSSTVGELNTPVGGSVLSALDPNTINFYDDFSEASLSSLDPAAVSPAQGGGQAHDNHMPYQEITYIICLNGLYPL